MLMQFKARNKSVRAGLYCSISVAALGMGFQGTASAQDQEAQGEAEEQTSGLSTIVVTAKKREQNLQEVPVAITALGSEALANAGIETTEDLSIAVPGLSITRQLSGVAPLIRGVGNFGSSPGFEGGVAVYVDDVYLSSAYGSLFSLANVERVEVLRGPQGTLFGRNATGGLIHVVTKEPSQETTGSASVSYGSQNTVEAKFYGSVGIGENGAADLSVFFRDQGDGFGTNINTGNDTLYRDEFAVRSKVLVEHEGTKIVLSADYADSNSDFGVSRRPLEGTTTFFGTPAPADFFDVNQSRDNFATNNQWGVSAKLEQELGSIDLIAIGSYRELNANIFVDQGEDPIPFIPIDFGIRGQSQSAEIRLQSSEDSSFTWVLGGYYYGAEDAADTLDLSGPGILGLTAPAPGSPFAMLPGPFERLSRLGIQNTRSLAIFGEGVVELDERSSLSFGGRFTSERKEFTQQTTFFGSTFSPLGQGTPLPLPQFNDSVTFDEPSWRVSIDRSFGEFEDFLVYATYSRGFKSGLYNTNDEFATAGPVSPEIIDAYELGFKSEFANGNARLNAAFFYNDYTDLQLTTQTQGTSIVTNVGSAETYGAEVEFNAAVTDELQFNLSGAWTVAEFVDFPLAELSTPNPMRMPCPGSGLPTPNCVGLGSAAGNRLPRVPEFTVSAGANYSTITSIGELSAAANVAYNDGSPQDFANRIEIGAYTLVNANASLSFGSSDQFTVRVFGQNLLNEEYFSYITATDFGDIVAAAAGRSYGIGFGVEW